MQNTSQQIHDDEIDLREIFRLLFSKWHWIALCTILGAAFGVGVAKFSLPSHEVSSTILVKDESKGFSGPNLFEGFELGNNTNIQNHVGILKSYSLNLQALQHLNWSTTWYKKGVFANLDLYKKSPLRVSEMTYHSNVHGVPLLIVPINNTTYEISADYTLLIDEIETDVKFKSTGEFGKRLKNKYFDFTIKKVKELGDSEYVLVFNNIELMALEYSQSLMVSVLNKDSELIELKIEGENLDRHIDYLNELSQVYIQFGLQQKNKLSLNTVRFIDSQLDGLVDSLKVTGKNFTDFRTKNKTIDLDKEAELVSEKIKELDSQETMLKIRLNYYENLRKYMHDAKTMNKVAAPSFMGIADASLNSQVVNLIELYTKREALRQVAQAKNPSMILLNKELDGTILVLEETVRNLIQNTKSEMLTLRHKMDEVAMHLASLPATEQQMINIKRSFDVNNELYSFLLKKRAEASITTASNIPDTQIIDIARSETSQKVGPKMKMLVVIGAFMGMILPIVLIFLIDFLNESVKSKEEVERRSALPILAEIGQNKTGRVFAVVNYPKSVLAESFRTARTNLQYILKSKQHNVIAVQSMMPGEGKTFNAINLAIVLAMNNKSVLLVGCDLRKPRLDKYFSLTNERGLSSCLIDQHSVDESIQTTDIKGLSVMCSGPIPPNPAELLGSEKFEVLIERVKQEYDYVLLDNSPLSLVTDGVLTGKLAYANVVVLRQGYSSRSEIDDINIFAQNESIKNVSIILNDVATKRGYGNGNGYYDDTFVKESRWRRLFSN